MFAASRWNENINAIAWRPAIVGLNSGRRRSCAILRSRGAGYSLSRCATKRAVGARRAGGALDVELLTAVIEAAPTAIVLADERGRIVLVNAATEKMFGYPREELLDRPVEMLLPQGSRGRRKDRSEFPIEIGVEPVVTGESTFALHALKDVSDRLRSQQEQRLLTSLVEGAEEYAIFLLDLNGFVTTWNAGAERIKGYRSEEIMGHHFSCFYTREDRERGIPDTHLGVARAAGRHAEEGWRVRRDGSRFWAHATLTALRDEAGEPIGYSKITRDLTTQRRAEQRFRATIESAPTAMVMIDAQGRIVLLNAATEELFGYERRELLRASVEVLLPERFRASHPQLREAFFARPEARPMGAGRDLFGLRRDGSEVPIEIGLSPVETDEGMFVLSAIVEITERKRLEDAQRKLHQELEQRVALRTAELAVARDAAQAANRAKSQFLANMSHEIRTPLNAVVSLTESLLRTELTATQRDYLGTVMDSGGALLDIINELLDFSKIEAGKLSLEYVAFDLQDAVIDAIRPQAIRAQAKGLDLACFIDPRLSPERIGDPVRLGQVITNLVSNAIKFTAHGEVVIRVEQDSSGGDRLHFSVRDSGIGVDPEQLDRMFEPFEQADPSTTRRHGGTGLGLSICRQLVELMAGEIGAASELGEGSHFFFSVPLAASLPARDESAPRDGAVAGRSVLIVDDRAASREVVAEIVQACGMRPALATSVAEAFDRLEKGLADGDPFSLAIADVGMSGVGGPGLTERIRGDARFRALAIILLFSAAAGDVDEQAAQHNRVSARLKKPVHPGELVYQIARAFGNGAAPGTSRRDLERAKTPASTLVPPQRILLVEDSVPNQKVVRAILAEQKHTLVVAANGREALAALRDGEFDLVLMDVQMPEMDGFEATAAIRAAEAATSRHVPIIAMTAHALPGDREKCIAAGMDDYVVKPIHREDLFHALERAARGGH
jgi:PAS domain S-box-containing protein